MVKFYRTDDKLIHELDTLQGGTWIQMVNPSVAEGQMVADELNVDIEDVLAALDEEESSRIELQDGYTVMPTITICTFLTLTNGFKLFDQNLALTGGNPGKMSELLALNIYNTMYGTTGWQGVGQAKAVIFFIIVAIIALAQNKITTSKEVQD